MGPVECVSLLGREVVVRIISAIRRFSPGERSRGVCHSVRSGAISQQGLMIPGSQWLAVYDMTTRMPLEWSRGMVVGPVDMSGL